MSLIQKILTLKLNKNYLPIGRSRVADLMVDLYTGVVCGLDVEYELDEEGTPVWGEMASMTPIASFEEWAELPIRDYDETIKTVRGEIRIPFTVVCSTYREIPNKQVIFPTKSNVWKRDKNRCLFTNIELNSETKSIDHIIPKDLGGAYAEWNNLATCHRELNTWKSNNLMKDCNLNTTKFKDTDLEKWRNEAISLGQYNLRLLKKPTKPRVTFGTVFEKAKPEWAAFMF